MKLKSLSVEFLINQDQLQENRLKNTFIDEQQITFWPLFNLFELDDSDQGVAILDG